MVEMPVAVVGAGPAGLAAAVALARAGVETLLLERRARPSSAPRATALSTATMELLRSWDLEPRVREGELGVELRPWLCETLAAAGAGRAIDAGFPTREQSALVSPTGPAGVPQSHLERVLEDHLRSLPVARVERGVEVTGVEGDADGVTLTAGERRIRCRYVVAADGIRSAVRGALGVPVTGHEDLGDWLVARFRAPLWELVGDRRFTLYAVTGAGRACIFLPAELPDRWVFGAAIDSARDEDVRVGALIRRAAGTRDVVPQIEHVGHASYGVHLADRFRERRVFLAGDAAHRVTPRGATGLNSAIRDGFDIGWKLAWVLRGWAYERLLDTYEAERRPVAEHNAARSADPNGSERDAARELWADLGGRIPHVRLDGGAATLDLLGDGLTLFTGPQSAGWRAAAGWIPLRAPVTVRELDSLTARALGIRGRGALLVRPDGQPVSLWSGDEQAAAALRTAASSLALRALPARRAA